MGSDLSQNSRITAALSKLLSQQHRRRDGREAFPLPFHPLPSAAGAEVVSPFPFDQPSFPNSNHHYFIFLYFSIYQIQSPVLTFGNFQRFSSKCGSQISVEFLNHFSAGPVGNLDGSSRHRCFWLMVREDQNWERIEWGVGQCFGGSGGQ